MLVGTLRAAIQHEAIPALQISSRTPLRFYARRTQTFVSKCAGRTWAPYNLLICKSHIHSSARQLSNMASADDIPSRPTRSLAGRVAIVTGAGSIGDGIGNGRASSILLAEAGASVVCVDLSQENVARTVSMIEEEGKGRAIAHTADVTDESQCKGIVDLAVATYGRLDILVNNVGIIGAKGTAVEVDMAEWAKSMEINVASMVQMAKYAIPEMAKNTGQWRGSIVLMGSVAGLKGGTPHLLYPTTKGAVVNMARAMAANHAHQGIRVNCVCPGMLYTPMMYGPGMTDEARLARSQRSLLKTEGNGWDCGAAVRFLASDEARWMTGVVLPVDAGATAAIGIELGEKP